MHIEPGYILNSDGEPIGLHDGFDVTVPDDRPWSRPDADVVGDIRAVFEHDNSYSHDAGGPRARYSNPIYPWFIPTVKNTVKAPECTGLGCWYSREGFGQCHERSDGVCILAQNCGVTS